MFSNTIKPVITPGVIPFGDADSVMQLLIVQHPFTAIPNQQGHTNGKQNFYHREKIE
jgi:hypothetical protein